MYQDILDKNHLTIIKALKIKHNLVCQQDNDPKHTTNTINQWCENKFYLLKWLS